MRSQRVIECGRESREGFQWVYSEILSNKSHEEGTRCSVEKRCPLTSVVIIKTSVRRGPEDFCRPPVPLRYGGKQTLRNVSLEFWEILYINNRVRPTKRVFQENLLRNSYFGRQKNDLTLKEPVRHNSRDIQYMYSTIYIHVSICVCVCVSIQNRHRGGFRGELKGVHPSWTTLY